MKKKSLFKNKLQMIIYFIIFALCIFLFILIGKNITKDVKNIENKKMNTIYSLVPDDNLFQIVYATDVLRILKGENGIVLMGFPSNVWTNNYASILNEVCTQYGIDKIYYYDFRTDRYESSGTYETIVNMLASYVPVDDEGLQDIQAPTVVFIKDGKVIAYFDETSIIRGNFKPSDYYSDEQIELTKEMFRNALDAYIE